jgi:hypothetical protein
VAKRFWNPMDNAGAFYLLVRSKILIGPTIALWIVFFIAPLYQGKMPRLTNSHKMQPYRINIDEEDSHHEDLLTDTSGKYNIYLALISTIGRSIVYTNSNNQDVSQGKYLKMIS